MTTIQTILLGALQGLTELFPISSLGHSVLLPPLLGWNIDQHDESFLILLIATHLATALVLLAFFFADYWKMLLGFLRSVKAGKLEAGDTYGRLAWLLIIATVPAGILGLVFQHSLKELFATPSMVALFLIGNGVLLYGAELIRRRREHFTEADEPDKAIAELSFLQALGIGSMQALALFPGFSRTGASLAGGLLSGLSHTAAARFSFFLATPIIFAAALLKLPELFLVEGHPVMEIIIGSLVSALAAFLTVKFLTKYFKTNTLVPFAIYCVVVGVASALVLGFPG